MWGRCFSALPHALILKIDPTSAFGEAITTTFRPDAYQPRCVRIFEQGTLQFENREGNGKFCSVWTSQSPTSHHNLPTSFQQSISRILALLHRFSRIFYTPWALQIAETDNFVLSSTFFCDKSVDSSHAFVTILFWRKHSLMVNLISPTFEFCLEHSFKHFLEWKASKPIREQCTTVRPCQLSIF